MPQYDIFGMPVSDDEASPGYDLFDQIEYERKLREEYQARRAAEIRAANQGVIGNELGGIATGINVGVNSLVAPIARVVDPLVRRAGSAMGYDTKGENYADFIASENDAMMQAQRMAVDQSDMGGVRKWFNRALPGATSSLGQAAAIAGAAPAAVPAAAAMALGFGATTGESSYAEARAAGLPVRESALYGAEQGIYEGGVQGLFSAIPGMAGTEGVVANAVRGGVKGSADDLYNLVRQPLGEQALRVGKNLASESAEELITTGLQTSATARTIPGQENATSFRDAQGKLSLTESPAGQAVLDTMSQVALMGAFGEAGQQFRGRLSPAPQDPDDAARQAASIATASGTLVQETENVPKGPQNEVAQGLPATTKYQFTQQEMPLVADFVNSPSEATRDLLPTRLRESVLRMDLEEAAQTLGQAAVEQRARENDVRNQGITGGFGGVAGVTPPVALPAGGEVAVAVPSNGQPEATLGGVAEVQAATQEEPTVSGGLGVSVDPPVIPQRNSGVQNFVPDSLTQDDGRGEVISNEVSDSQEGRGAEGGRQGLLAPKSRYDSGRAPSARGRNPALTAVSGGAVLQDAVRRAVSEGLIGSVQDAVSIAREISNGKNADELLSVLRDSKAPKTGKRPAPAQKPVIVPGEASLSGNVAIGEKPAFVPSSGEPVQTVAGEMTLDDFEKKGYTPDQVTRQDWVNLQRAARRGLGQAEESGTQYAPYADYEEFHRQAVKEAIDSGDEVDKQVLADYPELTAKKTDVADSSAAASVYKRPGSQRPAPAQKPVIVPGEASREIKKQQDVGIVNSPELKKTDVIPRGTKFGSSGRYEIYPATIGGKSWFAVRDLQDPASVERGAGDTLHGTIEEAYSQVSQNERSDSSKAELLEDTRKQEESEYKDKSEKNDIDGFKNGSAAIERGRAVNVLSGTNVRWNGVLSSRRDAIRRLVAEGRNIVVQPDGSRILEGKDGVYFGDDQTTKIGMDYAEHLIALRDSGENHKKKPVLQTMKLEGGQSVIPGMEAEGSEINERQALDKKAGPVLQFVAEESQELADDIKPVLRGIERSVQAIANDSQADSKSLSKALEPIDAVLNDYKDFPQATEKVFLHYQDRVGEVIRGLKQYGGFKVGGTYFDDQYGDNATLVGFNLDSSRSEDVVAIVQRNNGRPPVEIGLRYLGEELIDLEPEARSDNSLSSEDAAKGPFGYFKGDKGEYTGRSADGLYEIKLLEGASIGETRLIKNGPGDSLAEGDKSVAPQKEKTLEEQMEEFTSEAFGLNEPTEKKAKGKRPSKAMTKKQRNQAIAAYFTPGKEVESYSGGKDRVISVDVNEDGTFSVQVESLETGKQRTHSTLPSDAKLREALESLSAAEEPSKSAGKRPRSKLGAKLEQTAEEKKAALKAKFEALRDFGKGGTTLYSIGGFDQGKAKATVDVLKAAVEYGTVKFADMVVLATEFIGESAVRELGPYFKAGWNTLYKSGKFGVDAATDVESVLSSMSKTVEKQEEIQPNDQAVEIEPSPTVRGTSPQDNHVIAKDDVIASPGIVGKLNANMSAIRLLRQLQTENRNATQDEKKVLAQFVGWGALPQVFNDVRGELMLRHPEELNYRKRNAYLMNEKDRIQFNYGNNPQFNEVLDGRIKSWEKDFGPAWKELKSLLSAGEITAAKDSTINAHYTSKDVIGHMWSAIGRMGLKNGRFIEPSAGIGSFIGMSPWSTNGSTAVEMDSVSAQLLEKLYPQSNVLASDFGVVGVAPGSYDLSISNVPFSDLKGTTSAVKRDGIERYGRELALHDYFLMRMIDATRPGGIVAAITSHHTMDKLSTENRQLLGSKADLVGAIRLPSNAFKGNAGTEVTTDILFFRRKTSNPFFGAKQFVETVQSGTDKVDGIDQPVVINRYFVENPEMVIGRHSLSGSMYGPKKDGVNKGEYTVLLDDYSHLDSMLADAVKKLPSNIASSDYVSSGETQIVKNDRPKPMNRLVFDGGQVKSFDGSGEMTTPDWLTRQVLFYQNGNPRKMKPADAAKAIKDALDTAKSYVELRDVFENHMDVMTSESPDSEVHSSMRRLNDVYDAFVAKNGYVTNNKLLRAEPSYWRIAALEVANESFDEEDPTKSVRFKKADVFSKRINTGIKEPTSISSVADGVGLSGMWRGHIDPSWIANKMGVHPDVVVAEILEKGLGYIDPETSLIQTKAEYLRGNVRQKLRAAEIAAKSDKRFDRNVEALKIVQPKSKALGEFDARLGSYWLPADVVEDFAKNVLGDNDARVVRDEVNDLWVVEGTRRRSREAFYNTKHQIHLLLQKILNNMEVKYVVMNDKVVDKAATEMETALAIAAKMRIIEEFKAFLDGNALAKKLVEDAYNEHVNHSQEGDVDDSSNLILPGSNQEIQLDPHQKKVVWRMVRERSGMFAHAPGAGKTFEMMATAMEMRRLGIARKPMMVVQNATLGQFAASFQRMYPNANVLVATTDDLTGTNRAAFLNRIAVGDYDAVVIPHSTFDLKLANNPKTEREYIEHQINLLEEQIKDAQREGRGSFTEKQIRKKMKSLEARLDTAVERAKKHNDQELYFEDLGIDALFVDEAHHYKKPFYFTNIDDKVRGVERGTSAAAMSATMKVRHIQGKMHGKNVFFATGTPITNTLGEVFHMIAYTSPDLLKSFGVDTFDKFVSQFASIETIEVINAAGRMVRRSVLAKFRNGEELGKLIRMAWDVLTSAQLSEEMSQKSARQAAATQQNEGESDTPAKDSSLPKRVSGGIMPVFVEQSRSFKNFFGVLKLVDATYESLAGRNKRKYSWVNVLAYNAAKYAAIDPRLVDGSAEDDPGSKVNSLVAKALEIYRLHPDKSQVIFSDVFNKMNIDKLLGFIGKKTGENIVDDESESDSDLDFDGESVDSAKFMKAQGNELFLYRDIVKKLIAGGVPAGKVAIINDYEKKADRDKLLEDVNTGKVQFIIGHTNTVGTGVNIQRNLIAAHHLESPWTPAAMDQRSARIIRQGNLNKEVYEFIYAMKDSIDGALLDKLDKKRVMYNQAMEGKLGVEFDDPMSEEIMSIREMVGVIQNDPLLKKSRSLETEIRDLRMQKHAHEQSQWMAQNVMSQLGDRLDSSVNRLAATEKSMGWAREFSPSTLFEFNGKTYAPDTDGLEDVFSGWVVGRIKKIVSLVVRGDYAPLRMPVNADSRGTNTEFHVGNVVRGKVGFQIFAAPVSPYNPAGQGVADVLAKERLQNYVGKSGLDEILDPGNRETNIDYQVRVTVNGDVVGWSSVKTVSGIKAYTTSLAERLNEKINEERRNIDRVKEEIGQYQKVLEQRFDRSERLESAEKELSETLNAMVARDALAVQEVNANPNSVSTDDHSTASADDATDDSGDGILARSLDAFNSAARTDGRPGRLVTKDSEPELSHTSVRLRLSKMFGLPIGAADYRMGNALGVYDPHSWVARTTKNRIGDMGTILHEVAHHIDNVLLGSRKLREIFRSGALQRELSGYDYDPLRKDRSKAVKEGFAEFIRMWATEPDVQGPSRLELRSPEVWAAWSDWLAKGGKLQSDVLRARDLVQRLQSQTPSDAIGSQIKQTLTQDEMADITAAEQIETIREQVGNLLVRKFIDDRADLKWFDKKGKEGGFSTKVGAWDLAVATDGSSDRHATQAFHDGVHRVSEGSVIPGLKILGKSIAQITKDAGIKDGLDRINAEKYAVARFAVENFQKNPEYRSPISVEDANAFIDSLGAEDLGRYETYANGLRGFAADLVRMLADSGVLSPSQAKAIIDSSRYYVPFMRITDDSALGRIASGIGGSSTLNFDSGVRRRSKTGSDSPIISPTVALFMQAQKFYGLANQMQVKLKMRETVKAVPGMGHLMQQLPAKTKRQSMSVQQVYDQSKDAFETYGYDTSVFPDIDPNAPGLTPQERQRRMDLNEALLSIYPRQYRAGEPHILTMNIVGHNGEVETEEWKLEPNLSNAINRHPEVRGIVAKIFKGFRDLVHFGSLETSAVFSGLNPYRDWQSFQKQTRFSKGLASATDPFVYLAAYMKARYANVNDDAAAIYERYGANLATRYGISSADPNRIVDAMAGGEDPRTSKAVRIGRRVGETFTQARELISLSEVGPRFSEFVNSLLSDGYERKWDGKTNGYRLFNIASGKFQEPPRDVIVSAILAAGDVTNNYKVKGAWVRSFDDFIPFIGAAVSGLSKSYRSYHGAITGDSKEANRGRVAAFSILSAAFSILYWTMRHDDDDYDEQEDKVTSLYWTFTDFNGNPILRIPKGHDTAIIPNLVEGLLNSLSGKKRHDFIDMVGETLDNLKPSLTLAGVTPAVESYFNYDFFRGKNLEYEGPGAEHPSTRTNPWTTDTARAIGKYTGEYGISPIRVEHFIDRVSGGFGLRAIRLAESGYDAASNPSIESASKLLYETARIVPMPFNPTALQINRDSVSSPDEFYRQKKTLSERLRSLRNEASEIAESGSVVPLEMRDEIRKLSVKNSVMERDADTIREFNRTAKGVTGRDERFKSTKYGVGIARKSIGLEELSRYPSVPDSDAPEEVKAAFIKEAESALRNALQNNSLNLERAVNSDGRKLDEETRNSIESARRWIKNSGMSMLQVSSIFNKMNARTRLSDNSGTADNQIEARNRRRALLGRIMRNVESED